jgi:hypothetical protein
MFGGHFHQLALHLLRPKVLTQRWIHDVTETLPNLQLALNHHLLCDLGPPLLSIMFEEYDEHEGFAESPSSILHAGVDAIMELIIDFFEGASFHVLADFLPIVPI